MVLLWDTSRPALKRQSWRTEELEKLDELWANLASADAAVAYKAIGRLSKAPAQAVPFLAKRLQPITVKDWRQIQQWIADLDDDRFAVRAKGSQELEKIGGLAEPRLSQALAKQPSMEMRHRILALQEKLRQQGPPGPRLRVLRAVTVLEWIGTPEAQQILKILATGVPEAPETSDARTALERLSKPAIARGN